MGHIELVLTDIDGTLVEINKHDPSPGVRKAMRDVQAAGVTITAATGRPFDMGQHMFVDLGFRGPCIFDGGASIRDVQTGELLWQNWLDVARLRDIVGIVLPHSTVIDFFPSYKEVASGQASVDDVLEPAPYVFAFVREAEFKDVSEKLGSVPGLNIHVGPGRVDAPGLVDLQITDIQSNKFHAVNALRELVHSSKHTTLAIGDSDNDIPLYENAGLKIAMGNATENLKALADHIVESVAGDGFVEAMRRFVLK